MAQTLTRILVHIIFSTKDRRAWITPEIESALFAYIGGICRACGCTLIAAGAADDHIHLLVLLSKTETLSDLLLAIKRDSSKWIKTQGPEFARFGWQDGYAGLSIGQSQEDAVKKYLAGQRKRHKTMSFKDELVALLEKYKVEYDPKYLWD